MRAKQARAWKRSRGLDCSLAHKVTGCDLLTTLVGLESVTTLHTLMVVGLRVRAHLRDINLNAGAGVAHAVALIDIAARSASHQNRG